jgi:hypothetical protein
VAHGYRQQISSTAAAACLLACEQTDEAAVVTHDLTMNLHDCTAAGVPERFWGATHGMAIESSVIEPNA